MREQKHTELQNIPSKKLAETTHGAIVKLDKDGKFAYIDSKIEKELGLDKSEIIDTTYSDLDWNYTDFKGNGYPREKLPFEKVKDTGKPVYDVSLAIELPKEQKKYLSVNASPLFDDDGNYDGMVAVVKDLTERFRDEEELKTGNQRYRRLFESAQDGMLILNADTGEIIDANPYIQNLSGFSKEELVGKELWEIGTFQDVVANRVKFEKLVEEGFVRYEHLPLKTKNGKEASVEFVSNTYMVDGEKVIQCNIRDITEQKKAEEKLRRSEKKFRSYVENAPVGVFLVDEEGNYREVNEAASKMTGYSEDELLDMSVPDLHSPEVMEQYQEAFQKLLEKGEMKTDLPYMRKNGREGYFLINAVKLSENRYLGFTLDITRRKEAEKKLERATFGTLQALTRTVEAKDEYTGEHIDRTQKLSVEIGKEVGLSEGRLEQLRYASILHDVGKIKIPDKILGKPDKLTEEEWAEMKKHPKMGEKIVGQVDQLKRAAEIIGQHQEKFDGSGYPRGLEGEELTLEARILTVADAWDAMRTDRPYREALSREEAINELRENAGSQFDPEIVDIMLGMLEKDETFLGME